MQMMAKRCCLNIFSMTKENYKKYVFVEGKNDKKKIMAKNCLER